ncbi:hypothetical protein [Hyphomonas johnsonii]|jgi:hypothetical protein|uniref:Uncharacterized protein n=1 Tax=Hyphomonas johnsonii MHS-2 TaxID=1280950 RepID=A0A059FQS2_9PROT|nr:hypothetical protein [Hyphomonas johnsonii]KCZ92881.1 hypothetical protein HJO_07997 [Hyphomonas johnsonii MHS-2]
MAKAIFHKSQRVFVKPVGTWALIEQVIPHWVKDVDEPLRVSYDCGLGRRFEAFELVSEQTMRQNDSSPEDDNEDDLMLEQWRIDRKLVKWRSDMLVGTNPNPETYPVVVTDDGDWGGWRVTGSEFDRDPQRVEHQARMIVHTPDLLRVASRLADFAGTNPDDLPEELRPLAQRCALILRQVYQIDRDQVEAAAE